MVIQSQPALLGHFSQIKTSKSTAAPLPAIPVIDISKPDAEEAGALLVKACEEFGFFKVINHGVPAEVARRVEDEAVRFFARPQAEKDRAGPADPFGYGNKRIGPNGDVGWIEYLLFNNNAHVHSQKSLAIFQQNPESFRRAVEDYIAAAKRMACQITEMLAGGLGIEDRKVFSKLLRDDYSDSVFRLNHYPPCLPELQQPLTDRNLVGFGAHTDPQIISILRSNDESGFQICLRDGSWASVPPDHSSFFVLVGDSLQVMTNGRFKSVKHRVLVGSSKSRVSMIYFGGPPLREKIAPLKSIMARGGGDGEEESLYKEFTWEEYKKAAYKSRLSDYRLGPFELPKIITQKSCAS